MSEHKITIRERAKMVFVEIMVWVAIALGFCLFAGIIGALVEGGCRVRL